MVNDGIYTYVIGDNPSAPGDIILTVVDGVIIAATGEIPLESPAHEEEIILDEGYYEDHISHQDDHLTEEQIRDVVENPDEVYQGTNTRGKTVYVWGKYVNGELLVVRGEDFSQSDQIPLEGIRIRSAYRDPPNGLEGLIRNYNLRKIYDGNQ